MRRVLITVVILACAAGAYLFAPGVFDEARTLLAVWLGWLVNAFGRERKTKNLPLLTTTVMPEQSALPWAFQPHGSEAHRKALEK